VHDLDVINYLFGLDMAEVHAVTERRIHSSHEDMVSALVKLRTGELVIMNTDWLTPTKIRKLTVTGEKGMAVIDYLSQELFFYENAMSKDRFKYAETVIGISEGTMSRPFIQKKEPLLEEIEGFVNYVRNGGDAPSVSAEDAAKALEAALAILENSNGGGKK
ncbi:gfo/Idh/MocA family oxidoreductase, partial [Candidatus Peregrinibacteria bacterium CG10_big_fil_rev_8_21_14_0_10_54_7]